MRRTVKSVRFGEVLPYKGLLKEVSNSTCINSRTTERIIKACFKKIHDCIEEGTAVHISDFGLFQCKERNGKIIKSCKWRNVWAPKNTRIHFQPCRRWDVEHNANSIVIPDPSDIPEGYMLSDTTFACIIKRIGIDAALAIYGKKYEDNLRTVYTRLNKMDRTLSKRNDTEYIVPDDTPDDQLIQDIHH